MERLSLGIQGGRAVYSVILTFDQIVCSLNLGAIYSFVKNEKWT